MKSEHARGVQRSQPASDSELSSLLCQAAQTSTRAVFGNDQLPMQADHANVVRVDLSKLDAVLEHEVADQVIAVQTGITIGRLNEMLSRHKQLFPARVPAEWTLLDVIARGETGALEHGYGSARELVLGCTVMLSDGSAIKCGGKVVKNVTGFDMTKMIVGSHCWLGVPVSAYLRLYALPDSSATLAWSFDSLVRLINCANGLLLAGLPFACLDIVQNDRLKFGDGRFALLAQVWSPRAVEEEIVGAAERLAGNANAHLSGEQEEKLWQSLTDEFLNIPPDQSLQVVAPATTLSDIAAVLPVGSRFLSRPARGKLVVACARPQEAVQALAELSRSLKQPFTVAIADSRYNYLVQELPATDPVKQRLKLRLKEKFDPANILNPFVQL